MRTTLTDWRKNKTGNDYLKIRNEYRAKCKERKGRCKRRKKTD